MGAILDLVGSAIIAGLLLLMLMSVNNNVSEFTILNGLSASAQENLVELATEVEYDFRKIGFRVGNPNTAIISCDSTSISFRSDIDNDMTLDTVSYSLGQPAQMTSTLNPNDRKLIRTVNAAQISSSLGLTLFRLRYYDSSGNSTWTASAVKGLEVALQVESPFPVDTTYARAFWRTRIFPKNL
jgi:hypothetical protein